jgi:hypothetical protein
MGRGEQFCRGGDGSCEGVREFVEEELGIVRE